MAITANPDARILVVCVDEAAVTGATIFNPNSWSGVSKGIVQSCWTEYSVLHHCVSQMTGTCEEAERLCQKHFATIQQQWCASKFDLGKVVIYGQVPDLHMQIEAFFSGVKTLLDLLVQLLSSEKIVSCVVDGFHRTQDVYGGKALNALENNVPNTRKDVAGKARALISEHKASWIDQAISARDQLIHPEKGMHQLMFRLDFAEKANSLVCVKVHAPEIGSETIDQYAPQVLKHVHEFSSSFIGLLKDVRM